MIKFLCSSKLSGRAQSRPNLKPLDCARGDIFKL